VVGVNKTVTMSTKAKRLTLDMIYIEFKSDTQPKIPSENENWLRKIYYIYTCLYQTLMKFTHYTHTYMHIKA
jgi:hypothetical protein